MRLHNIREWADDKHHSVDDRPFGGGPGMVLMVEPVVECVEAVRRRTTSRATWSCSRPRAGRSTRRWSRSWPASSGSLLVCGRYEGFDERIRRSCEPDEISIGDFILNGGEVAAMAVIDSVIRLVPDVLGDEDSSGEDSFSGRRAALGIRPVHAAPGVPGTGGAGDPA